MAAFLAALPIIGKIVAPLLNRVFGVIDQVVVDKDEANRLKSQIQLEAMGMDHKEFIDVLNAQRAIITAEITSDSWIARSWRPIIMLMFAGMLGSHWLGYTPQNLNPEMMDQLFFIIKLGLGGYIIGRSGEKIAKQIINKQKIKE